MTHADLHLEQLLAPVSPADFFAAYWERRPLHVPGHPRKFEGLFDLDSFYRAVTEVRLPDLGPRPYLKAGHADRSGDHRELFARPEQVPSLLRAGMTIQAELLDRVDERLQRLMTELRQRLSVAAAMDVGAFLSPDGAGYGLHFDATAMWTLQIEGCKRWWYSAAPEREFPRHNHLATAAERERLAEVPLVEQRLAPGDLLYLPPGTWHRARAEGQSLHLSLTVRASSPLDLFRPLLEERLLDRPAWRRLPTALCDDPAAGAAAPAGPVEAILAARLDELRRALESITPADLYRCWNERVRASAGEAPPIARGDRLRLAAPVRVVLAEDQTRLFSQGRPAASLPAHASRFAGRLVEQDRFIAEAALAWEPDYDWEDVSEALRVLVDLGLLEREP